MIKIVLTIAGSDCSGGAGIQADIKTITVHKMYAMSVITALTSQNTMGVFDILDVTPEFVASQLDSIFTDIMPDAVKIGMVSNDKIIEVIAQKLIQYNIKNIVVDPVMISTSGCNLLSSDAKNALCNLLLPLGTVITPNILEAEVLCDFKIYNQNDMEKAAIFIKEKYNCSVLVKGGHQINDANDYLLDNDNGNWFYSTRIKTSNTHGTGCTLSSAIACNLANGLSLNQSISNAKEYLTGALMQDLNLGKGNGPLNHTYSIK